MIPLSERTNPKREMTQCLLSGASTVCGLQCHRIQFGLWTYLGLVFGLSVYQLPELRSSVTFFPKTLGVTGQNELFAQLLSIINVKYLTI